LILPLRASSSIVSSYVAEHAGIAWPPLYTPPRIAPAPSKIAIEATACYCDFATAVIGEAHIILRFHDFITGDTILIYFCSRPDAERPASTPRSAELTPGQPRECLAMRLQIYRRGSPLPLAEAELPSQIHDAYFCLRASCISILSGQRLPPYAAFLPRHALLYSACRNEFHFNSHTF